MKKLALCQPYFAPYMGYFQLINEVDVFVSYDDVNFIKGGWIHRNKLIVNNREKLIGIPLIKQSSFKKINETEVNWDIDNIDKLMKTIEQSYSKSPYLNDVLGILEKVFEDKPEKISELALKSIIGFCDYLDIDTEIKVASEIGYERTDDRVLNIVNICKNQNSEHYINPIGGTKLYDKTEFKNHGIKLNFIEGLGSLSIIDVCLTKPKEEIKEELNKFKLI
jgi:hypothetical protein